MYPGEENDERRLLNRKRTLEKLKDNENEIIRISFSVW